MGIPTARYPWRALGRLGPLLGLLLALACSAPIVSRLPGLARDRVDLEPARAVLRRAVERGLVAGAAALVEQRGRVVLREAVGMADRERRVPVAHNTLFRIASMTKPITSAAVLLLRQEGRLRLDDLVAAYVPEFEGAHVLAPTDSDPLASVPVRTAPTIRHLLTHTAGITYRFLGHEPLATLYAEAGVSDGLADADFPLAVQMRRLGPLPLMSEPGTAYSYGLSTDVLGRVVEAVSGQTLDAFLRERIFLPLAMRDTGFAVTERSRPRLATVYDHLGGTALTRLHEGTIVRGHLRFSVDYPYAPPVYLSGGAGLVSTLDDYLRFARMLLGQGEIDGVRLLEADTVAEMTQSQIGGLTLPNGNGFGLGVSVQTRPDGPRPLGTFGWGGFFHTVFWVDPQNGLIGIFMAQHPPAEGLHLTEDFVAAVYAAVDSGM